METLIASRTNKRVTAIRRLHSRREREETGLFWAEGIRIVVEAASLGARFETLVVAPALLRSEVAKDLVASQRERSTPVIEVSGDVFESLSVKDGPQGLGAVIRQQWSDLAKLQADEKPAQPRMTVSAQSSQAPASGGAGQSSAPPGTGQGPASQETPPPQGPPLWVALDAVQDPGNLGTIIRTSDAAGGHGVVLTGQATDPYDPASVRASMGSLFAQRLARGTFAELMSWAKAQELTVVGTSGAAAKAYDDKSCASTYKKPLVLLMGSEREGLSAEQQAACDLVVKIPMVGRCDSLNLAVATGIMLYEIRRRRG